MSGVLVLGLAAAVGGLAVLLAPPEWKDVAFVASMGWAAVAMGVHLVAGSRPSRYRP